MKKFQSRWLLVFVSIFMIVLCSCSDNDDDNNDPTGPGSNYFPATYNGNFRFDGITIDFPFEFTVWTEENVSGTISGTDDLGNWYSYTISGGITDYTLTMTLAGEYGPPPCAVSGAFTGTSNSDYSTFTGTWTYETCYGITFTGTWTATRV